MCPKHRHHRGTEGSSYPGLVAFVAYLYVLVVVQIKRWHDLNFSGLWVIVSLTGMGAIYI